MATTPTRRKKRLGKLLEQLRADAGKSLFHAGEMLRLNESSTKSAQLIKSQVRALERT